MDSEEQKKTFDTQTNKYDDRNAVELKLTEIIKDQITKYSAMNSEDDDEETDQIIDLTGETDIMDLSNENYFFKLLNSVTYIGLIVAIEKEFDIEFNTEELRLGKFQSLHDLSDYIIQNKN